MTKFGKNCCRHATFHHFFHNLNDFYHIILFVQLLFFGIICFLDAKLQFFFILSLSFSFTHSLFLKVDSDNATFKALEPLFDKSINTRSNRRNNRNLLHKTRKLNYFFQLLLEIIA